MKLTFKRIMRKSIFCDDFLDMPVDNELVFPESGIVVVYGPNGVGKSSLAAILEENDDGEFTLLVDGTEIQSNDDTSHFHVISDQNGRNVIQGTTEDFILGDNIRREYELKRAIESGFDELFNRVLIPKMKTAFGIDKKNAPILQWVTNKKIATYASDLANRRSKGKGIDRQDFLSFVDPLPLAKIPEHDESKLKFLVEDVGRDNSVVAQLSDAVKNNLSIDPTIATVGQHGEAIEILNRYYYLNECIVCDTSIDRDTLLKKKEEARIDLLNQLDQTTKSILDGVQDRLYADDPFEIMKAITHSAASECAKDILDLMAEFRKYLNVMNRMLNNLFGSSLDGRSLVSDQKEYESIVEEKPELTDEDVLFIESFVNDCIDRKIELQRDQDGNLQLLLGKEPFLNEDRKDLRLSNGEQNFISIAFELLKAKKVESEFIVLDDPISSFDSIYKNKITYAIAKFLENKRQILLTHTTDMIRLLEHQKPRSFNLYLLNNTEGERNGFISVAKDEQDLLLYLHKLVDFFRHDVQAVVKNERLFLLSLVPFMRSFSRIVDKPRVFTSLTEIMHGYGDAKVNLTDAYTELFGSSFFSTAHLVSIQDILQSQPGSTAVLDDAKYPMLNRALVHGFTYLWLRLKVESTLIAKYQINTNRHDQLSSIIRKAFDGSDQNVVRNRVFLLSRKTLLNEFNHFEQDMNVFQPALDITDTALQKEYNDIIGFLEDINRNA